jgi:benzodiazapine receptor
MNNFFRYLLIFIPVICGSLIASVSGSFKTDKEYNKLKKSKVMPPNYVFGIVWPILYIMIGISYYIGINPTSYKYFVIPIISLVVNYSYTPIFLQLDNLKLSLIIVLLTLLFGILTIIQFYYYNKYACLLLIPYILWLMFASYLSYDIYIINKKNNKY